MPPPLERVREAVIVRDLGDHILLWNQGAEKLYGWGVDEMVGRRAAEVLAADPGEWDAARRHAVVHGGWAGELAHLTRTGRRGVSRCRWTLLHDADRVPALLLGVNAEVVNDGIPRLLGMADRGRVAAFAGELAHDLNNVLTPVVMAIKLLHNQPLGDDAREILATAAASVTRAVAMMDRLHELAASAG